jgi:hypothetical protein
MNGSVENGGAVSGVKNVTIANCTFFANTLTAPTFGGGVAAYLSQSGTNRTLNNVIVGTAGAQAVVAPAGLVTDCNVYWDTPDGIGVPLAATDRVIDPLFCDPTNGDLTVHAGSPCLPANSGGCGLIGALGQGCGTVAVEGTSWGRIKATYRDAPPPPASAPSPRRP